MSGCGAKDGVKDNVKDNVKDDVNDGRRRTARCDAGIRNRAMLPMQLLAWRWWWSTRLGASSCPGALVLQFHRRPLRVSHAETYK